jgi:diguanylate cyclase (GGDEF)-like protein
MDELETRIDVTPMMTASDVIDTSLHVDRPRRRAYALEQLVAISIAVMQGADLGVLMRRVTLEARRVTNAEAGTLFLRQGPNLVFTVAQNDVLMRTLGDQGLKDLFQDARLPVDEPSLAGFTARTGQILSVADAYSLPPDAPYHFNAAWDRKSGYRTGSVLLVPLTEPGGNNVGVLELINARDETGRVVAFNPDDEALVRALSAQVAAAIENARLRKLSFGDPLTGAYNRRYFLARLEEEINRHRRSRQPFALVLFDIDNFKWINDRHGHVTGDSVLATVSHLLRGQSRGFTVLARLGGDEFGALLVDTGKESAQEYAERIRCVVESYPFAHGRVTMSGGVAGVPEDIGGDLTSDRLIDTADKALYEAKRRGRNMIRWHEGRRTHS